MISKCNRILVRAMRTAPYFDLNQSPMHNKGGIDYTGKSKCCLISPATLVNPAALLFGVDGQQDNAFLTEEYNTELVVKANPALEHRTPVVIESTVSAETFAIGALLSNAVFLKYGEHGLPQDTIHIKLKGRSGLSLGCGLMGGIGIELEGCAEDYVGSFLFGGRISIYPYKEFLARPSFVAQEHQIVGDMCLHRAVSGQLFARGRAGEYFAAENAGALAVIEGAGGHCCEKMSGGVVVLLGHVDGRIADDITGGVVYLFDPHKKVGEQVHPLNVMQQQVDTKDEQDLLRSYLQRHLYYTRSPLAENILVKWPQHAEDFVKLTSKTESMKDIPFVPDV
jgi:glutamate synthase domain-containing protein 3